MFRTTIFAIGGGPAQCSANGSSTISCSLSSRVTRYEPVITEASFAGLWITKYWLVSVYGRSPLGSVVLIWTVPESTAVSSV